MNLKDSTSEIYFDFTLKGDSIFWLILRSNTCFDKFSAILKISKEEKSQKIFASYGTFVFDKNSLMIFKVFLKQQIIDKSMNSNKVYKENDVSRIKGSIVDNGQEKLLTNIYRTLDLILVNDDLNENLIAGSFFLPFIDKYNLMIAGE